MSVELYNILSLLYLGGAVLIGWWLITKVYPAPRIAATAEQFDRSQTQTLLAFVWLFSVTAFGVMCW